MTMMMQGDITEFAGVEAVVFDLDGTLVDFYADAERAVKAVLRRHDLLPDDWASFFERYKQIAMDRWEDFRNGRISKIEMRRLRLREAFANDHLPDALLDRITAEYLDRLGRDVTLMPGVSETLPELAARYRLGVITNGFVDASESRLASTGLDRYFEAVVVAEAVNCFKPDAAIFAEMLRRLEITATRCVYVGDNLIDDVGGARDAGLRPVYYAGLNSRADPLDPEPDAVIRNMVELLDIL